MNDLLNALSDDARVWLYVADRPLTKDEQAALTNGLAAFFRSWHTHKIPVVGGAAVLHDQLLAVAGTTPDGPDLSGCGIDQHVREVEQLGSRLGVTWLGGLDVAFLRPNAERLETAMRPAFKRGLAEGTIPMDSRVLDVATSTLGALRRGEALRPVADGPFARWIPDVPAL